MHYLLIYDVVPDYAGRRAALRAEHLALARAAHARGEPVLGGALADPVDGSVLLFAVEPPLPGSIEVRLQPVSWNAGASVNLHFSQQAVVARVSRNKAKIVYEADAMKSENWWPMLSHRARKLCWPGLQELRARIRRSIFRPGLRIMAKRCYSNRRMRAAPSNP